MNTQLHEIGQELLHFVLITVGLAVLLQILFSATSVLATVRLVVAFFLVFLLPGYSFVLVLAATTGVVKEGLLERYILSGAFGALLTGTISFILGRLFWPVNTQQILPLLIFGIGLVVALWIERRSPCSRTLRSSRNPLSGQSEMSTTTTPPKQEAEPTTRENPQPETKHQKVSDSSSPSAPQQHPPKTSPKDIATPQSSASEDAQADTEEQAQSTRSQ